MPRLGRVPALAVVVRMPSNLDLDGNLSRGVERRNLRVHRRGVHELERIARCGVRRASAGARKVVLGRHAIVHADDDQVEGDALFGVFGQCAA